MNIIEQNKEKINGILETFDRIWIPKVNAKEGILFAFSIRIGFAFSFRLIKNL